MISTPFVIDEQNAAVESSPEERCQWRTLTSADRAPSRGLTSGVAEIEPGGGLALHRHAPHEVYYILDGHGVVTLGDQEHVVGPGAAVYIPGDTPHAFRNAGTTLLRFFWVFPTDSYGDVEYVMLD